MEQNTVTKGINPANSVYNSRNTVAVPKEVHQEISRFYSSRYGDFSSFREYVNTLSYEEQFKTGLGVLNEICSKFGVLPFWL